MWQFVLKYDHVISAGCDIICTVVMLAGILKNRKRIDENRQKITELETIWCPKTGKKERRKK